MACLIQRNGIFYAIFSYQGKRVWRSTYTKNRTEAMERLKEMQGEFIEWKRMTILDLRDHLTKLLDGQLARATMSTYDFSLRQFSHVLGNKTLRAVTPYDIELFKSVRLKEASPVTVGISFRTVKAAFAKAVRLGMLMKSPFDGIRNVEIPEMEPVFLSSDEFKRLVVCIEEPQLKAIVVFAVCTSMRLGEILSLKWVDNVDLERGYIHLKNRPDFTVKAKRRRSVPLNATAVTILGNLERKSDYVFCNPKGGQLLGNFVSKKFKACARKAGLPEAIHFHSLRHTGASWLIQQEVPIVFVQRILGHSTVRTTEIYAHATGEHLQQSVSKLDELIADKPKEAAL
jgi:integrase